VPRFDPEELLGGSDQEFLVRLYGTLLGRWPDEEGYRHYLARIAGRPDQRLPVIAEIAGGEEAQQRGVSLGAADAAPAADEVARLAADAGALGIEIARLRMAAALRSRSYFEAHARAAIAARLRPLEERLARLEQAAAR